MTAVNDRCSCPDGGGGAAGRVRVAAALPVVAVPAAVALVQRASFGWGQPDERDVAAPVDGGAAPDRAGGPFLAPAAPDPRDGPHGWHVRRVWVAVRPGCPPGRDARRPRRDRAAAAAGRWVAHLCAGAPVEP